MDLLIGLLLLILPLIIGYIILSKATLGHITQIVITSIVLGCLVASSYFLLGHKVSQHLVSGLGLAIGIALQPLFKKLIDGIIFDGTAIKKCDSVEIAGYKGKVVKIGLLHTWLQTEGEAGKNSPLVMINNELLETKPIEICSNEFTRKTIATNSGLKFL